VKVTKIIREYVENTVRKSYNKKVNALRNQDKTEGEKQYDKWAAEAVKTLIEEAKAKVRENGLIFDVPSWSLNNGVFRGLTGEELENKKFEEGFKSIENSLRNSLSGCAFLLRSEEALGLDEKIRNLSKECEDKIYEILIGLEIGDINKKELDDVLAPFKSGE